MPIRLRIVDNLHGFEINQPHLTIAAGERQQFPLLITIALPSANQTETLKLSSKAAIQIEVISIGVDEPVNQIETAFFMPNIMSER